MSLEQPAPPKREQWDAFILLTDIVDFSKLPTWAQQQAVDHLLAGLEA